MEVYNRRFSFPKNIAQAPCLDELLSENLKSNDFQLTIKHNDDYDSELTDFEEDSRFCRNAINDEEEINDTKNNGNNSDDCVDKQMDFNNNAKSNGGSDSSTQHRSLRLKELNVVLADGPGALTRSLFELINSMNSSNSTVNPSSFHSAFCKRF